MMLSPGKWHLQVPKEPLANLRFRKALLEAAARDEKVRRGLMEICRQDCLFWINFAVWQFNPDLRQKGPFISFDFQDKAIVGGEVELGGVVRYQHGILQCVEDRESVRWPKSRYVGATWLSLMAAVWLCLFHENVKILAMSKDEKSAEEADNPDSLFWKIKFMTEHLPDWMLGGLKGLKGRAVFGGLKSKKGVMKFLRYGNTITTCANVESAGVGGRATMLIADEFGQFEKGHEIYSMTSDTSDCRVFIFTHKGQQTMAYQLCFDVKYKDMREIVTHWSQHPEKRAGLYRYDEEGGKVEVLDKGYKYPAGFEFVMDTKPLGGPCPGLRSPWYDHRTRHRSEYDIAMNLDIDPVGSKVTFFDGYRIGVLKAAHAMRPLWEGSVVYDKVTGHPQRLERGGEGLLKLWVHPKSERELPRMRAGAAVDVSAGSGTSPSCLSMFSAQTGEKVLQYSNAKIYAPDFATLVVAVCRMVRDDHGAHPLLGWEIQGSAAFARRVQDELRYGQVYVRRDEDIVGRPRDNKGRAGWAPNAKSILTLMEEYRDALYDQRCVNRCEEALDETLKFVYTSNGVEYRASGLAKDDGSGARVHHGDMVRADALAYKMCKELGFDVPGAKREEEWLSPMTAEGRERLAERAWSEEESEVWV